MNMFTVYLDDRALTYAQGTAKFKAAADWADKHCKSYIGYTVEDLSDVSYTYDQLAVYKFKDDNDVTMFTLKWS